MNFFVKLNKDKKQLNRSFSFCVAGANEDGTVKCNFSWEDEQGNTQRSEGNLFILVGGAGYLDIQLENEKIRNQFYGWK